MRFKKILVIDDDPIFCFILQKLLSKHDLNAYRTFHLATDAFTFLTSMDAPQEEYLIFLDINMPVMNGWEFLNLIQKTNGINSIQVAVITSSIDPADQEKARSYSCVIDLIKKPVDSMHLKHIFEQTL